MGRSQTVFIVDDDKGVRDGLGLLLDTVGQRYELFSSALDFLNSYDRNNGGCLVLDIRMPQMTGLDLQARLAELNSTLPIIFITGHGDIPMAVEAMRKGALDFIRKPFRDQELLDRINEALSMEQSKYAKSRTQQQLKDKVDSLTDRELEIFHRVCDGQMNKVIALALGISERTVEVYRAKAMQKLGARTLAQMVRIKIETDLLNENA